MDGICRHPCVLTFCYSSRQQWSSLLSLSAISVPLYVLAFLSGNFIARAVFGFPVLLVMVGFLGWIVARSLKIRLTVARLTVLGALFTLIVGSVCWKYHKFATFDA